MPPPAGESELRSPGTPNGDVSSQSEEDKDRLEYLDMNFKYPFVVFTSNFAEFLRAF